MTSNAMTDEEKMALVPLNLTEKKIAECQDEGGMKQAIEIAYRKVRTIPDTDVSDG